MWQDNHTSSSSPRDTHTPRTPKRTFTYTLNKERECWLDRSSHQQHHDDQQLSFNLTDKPPHNVNQRFPLIDRPNLAFERGPSASSPATVHVCMYVWMYIIVGKSHRFTHKLHNHHHSAIRLIQKRHIEIEETRIVVKIWCGNRGSSSPIIIRIYQSLVTSHYRFDGWMNEWIDGMGGGKLMYSPRYQSAENDPAHIIKLTF